MGIIIKHYYQDPYFINLYFMENNTGFDSDALIGNRLRISLVNVILRIMLLWVGLISWTKVYEKLSPGPNIEAGTPSLGWQMARLVGKPLNLSPLGRWDPRMSRFLWWKKGPPPPWGVRACLM